eukprot:g53529.t1
MTGHKAAATHRRNLRRRLDCTRFKKMNNVLVEQQPLSVTVSGDLKFICFHVDRGVCCIPFIHLSKALFGSGSREVDIGEADPTRTISLFFLSIQALHVELPSNCEAQEFLKAISWLKSTEEHRLNAQDRRQSLSHDKIRIFHE